MPALGLGFIIGAVGFRQFGHGDGCETCILFTGVFGLH
jgi:hypothetical protein